MPFYCYYYYNYTHQILTNQIDCEIDFMRGEGVKMMMMSVVFVVYYG